MTERTKRGTQLTASQIIAATAVITLVFAIPMLFALSYVYAVGVFVCLGCLLLSTDAGLRGWHVMLLSIAAGAAIGARGATSSWDYEALLVFGAVGGLVYGVALRQTLGFGRGCTPTDWFSGYRNGVRWIATIAALAWASRAFTLTWFWFSRYSIKRDDVLVDFSRALFRGDFENYVLEQQYEHAALIAVGVVLAAFIVLSLWSFARGAAREAGPAFASAIGVAKPADQKEQFSAALIVAWAATWTWIIVAIAIPFEWRRIKYIGDLYGATGPATTYGGKSLPSTMKALIAWNYSVSRGLGFGAALLALLLVWCMRRVEPRWMVSLAAGAGLLALVGAGAAFAF